ncbi:MAG: DUF3303 domain-containing protein [Phycisphaerales bacterium]
MLMMVIERFRAGSAAAVGERFRSRGRLMPQGCGVEYVASWMAADGASCYQLMEAPDRESLDPWMANWADLVEFEVVAVRTSAEFWAVASPAL